MMPTLRTLDVIGLEWKERSYREDYKKRWLSHEAWLRDMVSKYDRCALNGNRYLRRGDETILICTVKADSLELWLGWCVRDDEIIFWSLFAACLELFGEDYFVTADMHNTAIWIR
jgi:hypothetical protein